MQSFGAFLLYKWHTDELTAKDPVPGYIVAILALACSTGLSSICAYLGVCLNSRCFLSISASLSLALILTQTVLAVILILDSTLLANWLCPKNDVNCSGAVDGLLKNALTALFISILCAIQIVALCSVRCLAKRTTDYSDLSVNSIDRSPLGQSLLANDWEARRGEFEERSKRRLEQQRAALSLVAKKGLQVLFQI